MTVKICIWSDSACVIVFYIYCLYWCLNVQWNRLCARIVIQNKMWICFRVQGWTKWIVLINKNQYFFFYCFFFCFILFVLVCVLCVQQEIHNFRRIYRYIMLYIEDGEKSACSCCKYATSESTPENSESRIQKPNEVSILTQKI